jgi:hypothetical protein
VVKYRSALMIAALALLAGGVCWLAPNLRGAAGIAAAAFAVVAGAVALMIWPRSVAFIRLRPRLLVTLGWSICAIGVVVGFTLTFLAAKGPKEAMDLPLYGGLSVALLGFMTARLPKMIAQSAQVRREMDALKVAAPAPTNFNGYREGFSAPVSLVHDARAFLKIAAPWAALVAAGFCLILEFGLKSGRGSTAAMLALFAIFGLGIAAIYVVVPTVLVAWFRWVIERRAPPGFIALPDRAVLSFAWRIWIALTALGVIGRSVTPTIVGFAHTITPAYAETIGATAEFAIDLLLTMLFSSVALVLPAVAVRDKAFNRTIAMIQGRKLWPGLPVGLLLSLAPYPVLAVAIGSAYSFIYPTVRAAHTTPLPLTPWEVAGLLLVLMVMFATLASGATFLSRAYLAIKRDIMPAGAP